MNSSPHYMLPCKRAGGGEVVVEEERPIHNATDSLVKKSRIDSAAASGSPATTGNTKSTNTTTNNNNNNNSNNHSSDDKNVEPPIMTLGNGNAQDIDEDLHSRQLAVYGRETMRRLFASNILISGMQGLGAEIGMQDLGFFFYFCYSLLISCRL